MKNTKLFAGLALVLALALGLAAFAESTGAGFDETADPEELTEAAEEMTEEAEAETEQPDAAQAENDQLREALDAYRSAKEQNRAADLEEELSAMVSAGQLTQEQADLILNSVKEQQALRDGKCPNCGYQFAAGKGMNGKGGRGRQGGGQQGGRGQQGGGRQGGRGMMGGRGMTGGWNQMPQQNTQDQGAAQQSMPNA